MIGEEERTANNAVYVEGLGPGILYSINYERSLSDFALRVGFGYVSVSATSNSGSTQTQASASIITVPITLSYLGVGSKTNIFELGVGATILHAGEGASSIDTDSSATAAHNQTLSEQRAAAVSGWLANAGVAASRLKTQGFGAARPVADNETALGRAQNRRVELVKG